MNSQLSIICETVVFALTHVLKNLDYPVTEFSIESDSVTTTVTVMEWAASVNTWVSRSLGRVAIVIVPEDDVSFLLVAISVERLLAACDSQSASEEDVP